MEMGETQLAGGSGSCSAAGAFRRGSWAGALDAHLAPPVANIDNIS